MPSRRYVLCVAVTLLALLAPAALASHEGGAPPAQGAAPPAQGAAPPGQPAAPAEAQQDDNESDTLLTIAIVVGLIAAIGALLAVRKRRLPSAPE